LTAVQTLKESTMSRTRFSLGKQLVVASALALGASCSALADEVSTDPSTGEAPANLNGGVSHGNLKMLAQNPCPQRAQSAGTGKKKDEQTIESKNPSANRGQPITSPTYFNQYPGQ
jgi:hypothetical protein